MRKLSQLIPVFEEIVDDPNIKIEGYVRYLRQAHLVKTGPRGPGAPDMTGWDCRNILLAIMGGGHAKDAATTVHTYRDLPLHSLKEPTEPAPQLHYLPLEKLCSLNLFHEALDLLLIRAVDGKLREKITAWEKQNSREPPLVVQLHAPIPKAVISAPVLGYKRPLEYFDVGGPPWGDLVRSSQITHETFLRLGEFLRGELSEEDHVKG